MSRQGTPPSIFAKGPTKPLLPPAMLTTIAPQLDALGAMAGGPLYQRALDERLLVPVGLQVNHMYVDGADLGELYDGAQASFSRAF